MTLKQVLVTSVTCGIRTKKLGSFREEIEGEMVKTSLEKWYLS